MGSKGWPRVLRDHQSFAQEMWKLFVCLKKMQIFSKNSKQQPSKYNPKSAFQRLGVPQKDTDKGQVAQRSVCPKKFLPNKSINAPKTRRKRFFLVILYAPNRSQPPLVCNLHRRMFLNHQQSSTATYYPDPSGESWFSEKWMYIFSNHTVDGTNPAPVDMVNIPLFTGFYTSQVVQDFFHQQ